VIARTTHVSNRKFEIWALGRGCGPLEMIDLGCCRGITGIRLSAIRVRCTVQYWDFQLTTLLSIDCCTIFIIWYFFGFHELPAERYYPIWLRSIKSILWNGGLGCRVCSESIEDNPKTSLRALCSIFKTKCSADRTPLQVPVTRPWIVLSRVITYQLRNSSCNCFLLMFSNCYHSPENL
jgi:hypothetical protein